MPPDLIDKLSSQDPSGNNKYLDWMLYYIYEDMKKWKKFENPKKGEYVTDPQAPNTYSSSLNFTIDHIIKVVQSFHKNVERLTPERVYEALEKRLGHIPTNFTLIKSDNGQKGIWESKNINAYNPHILSQVLNYIIDTYPSKGEMDAIRREQTVNIYEDDKIKIVAPQSFASSCMYGANTKWCTTSKTKGFSHFKEYTRKNNVLIYFIFKKPKTFDQLNIERSDYESIMDRELRNALTKDPNFNKLALYYNINNGVKAWYDEVDSSVDGLNILKTYIRLSSDNPEQEFETIKGKINQYIKSKDQRYEDDPVPNFLKKLKRGIRGRKI